MGFTLGLLPTYIELYDEWWSTGPMKNKTLLMASSYKKKQNETLVIKAQKVNQ